MLEIRCGDGFLAARLSQRIPNVVAVDVDAPVVERGKQRFPSAPVKWLRGDILDIAEELGDFDAVVSNATLHDIPDTRASPRKSRSIASLRSRQVGDPSGTGGRDPSAAR